MSTQVSSVLSVYDNVINSQCKATSLMPRYYSNMVSETGDRQQKSIF